MATAGAARSAAISTRLAPRRDPLARADRGGEEPDGQAGDGQRRQQQQQQRAERLPGVDAHGQRGAVLRQAVLRERPGDDRQGDGHDGAEHDERPRRSGTSASHRRCRCRRPAALRASRTAAA